MKFIRLPKFKFVCLRNKVDKRIINHDTYNWVMRVILSCTTLKQVKTANRVYHNYCKLYQPDMRMKWDLHTQLVLKRNDLEINDR